MRVRVCKSNSITVNGSGKKRWKNKESRWQRRTEWDVKMKIRRRDEIWAAMAKRERDKKKREMQPIVDLSFYICPCVTLRWTVHGVPRQLPCVSWNWFYPLQPRVYQMDE